MKIKLDNLNPAQGTLAAKGTQVEFTLAYSGSADVTTSLSRRGDGAAAEPENRNRHRRGHARALTALTVLTPLIPLTALTTLTPRTPRTR